MKPKNNNFTYFSKMIFKSHTIQISLSFTLIETHFNM
jgi:hypothetical protein